MLPYPHCLQFVVGLLGCFYAGMIAVPTPVPGRYGQGRRRLKAVTHAAGVRAILTDAASLPVVSDWAADAGLTGVACLATDGGDFPNAGTWFVDGGPRSALSAWSPPRSDR